MKVSIGSKVVEGPYGGGNLFVKNLSSYLLKKGNSVVYDLKDKDIDIILIINPLKNSESGTFNHLDALFYSKFVNKKSIIVQRINECDERKDTNNVNTQIIQANKFADYTVYVSQWISDLFNEKGLDKKDSIFVTRKGREVKGGGGITPDLQTRANTYTSFVNACSKT